MLRGEDMTLCDLYLQTEAGFDVLHRIGDLECAQFIDMNWSISRYNRHFVSDLCRCADMENDLKYMRTVIISEGLKIPRLRDLSQVKPLHPSEMFQFEHMIDSWTKDVKDMSANHENLKKLKSETRELRYVLEHLDPILGNVEMGNAKLPRSMSQSEGPMDWRKLKIITGVVERSTSYQFQTMLWRISHGNAYYKEADHDETFQNPLSGRVLRKVAFVIICHGEELHQRVLKVCNGFNVHLYRWPETHEDRVATVDELSKRMIEMDKVLERTKYQRAASFRNIAVEWDTWMTQVVKAKAVYYQLNMFNMDISSNTLIGQCWMPDRRYDEVEASLETASETIGARSFMVRTITHNTPPTYYRTNKFTDVFQAIISSYQIGRYKELNPAIFAVITFPFLFGVMFGDVGHGFLLFVYALWMINNENKYMYRQSNNQVWNLVFRGRYMMMLMGLFAMYMGFLYNEWFSLTCKMMSPYWLNTIITEVLEDYDEIFELLAKEGSVGYVYKFGIDPGIKFAEQALAIENSVKMKLAIILGVAHVVLGLLIGLWNYIYFKKYYAIFFHFLPKLVFILSIYGFLCYVIFYKWLFPVYLLEFKKMEYFEALAQIDFRPMLPNLRDEFLHFVLWAKTRDAHPVAKYASDVLERPISMFSFDILVLKTVLYHIALMCFPVLLFGSPIYLYVRYRMRMSRMEREGRPYQMGGQDSLDFKKHQEFRPGRLLVHRIYRTMEFGLATVSHMASYLRLWALSLAHSLLSDLVWHLTLRKLAFADRSKNGIWKVYFVFIIWAAVTLFFLVIMDSLAVFIHVLRLHWIEFMSKFFKGDGVPFRPFKLSTVRDKPDVKREAEITKIRKVRKEMDSGDF